MANLHLITGYAGREHITSEDIASFNIALFGAGAYVLDRGDKFGVETISNTQIKIKSGDILFQGRHIRLNLGQKVEINFEIGEQGKNRKDLVVVRYSKDRVSEVEEANLVVIKGTSTTGSAQRPQHTVGDMVNSTATTADMPLYEVSFNGLNIQTPVQVFELLDINGSNKMKAKLEAEISKKVDRVKALNRQNLDTIYKEGNYSCKDCSNRASDANSQGSLSVYKADTSTDDTSITDTIQEYIDKNNNIYVRNSIDRSSWTSWKKVGIDENLSGLRTNAKNSLVAAINEVFQLGTSSAGKIKSKVSALLDKSFSNLTDVATELDKYDLDTTFREVHYIERGAEENSKIYLTRNYLVIDDEIYNLDNFQKLTLRSKVNSFSDFSSVILITPRKNKYSDDYITNMKLIDTTTGNYMGIEEVRNFVSDNSFNGVGKVVTTNDDILILFKSNIPFVYSFRKRRKVTGVGTIKDFNLKYLVCSERYSDRIIIDMQNGKKLKELRNIEISELVGNTEIGISYKNALTLETYNILTGTKIKEIEFKEQIKGKEQFVKISNSNLEYFEFLESGSRFGVFSIYRINKNGNLEKMYTNNNRNVIQGGYIYSYNSKYLVADYEIYDGAKKDLRVLKVDKYLKKVR